MTEFPERFKNLFDDTTLEKISAQWASPEFQQQLPYAEGSALVDRIVKDILSNNSTPNLEYRLQNLMRKTAEITANLRYKFGLQEPAARALIAHDTNNMLMHLIEKAVQEAPTDYVPNGGWKRAITNRVAELQERCGVEVPIEVKGHAHSVSLQRLERASQVSSLQ